jgi:predicted enzyme related to lactoylglutathione lyase
MGRVIHFEIHAAQPARAIGFYEKMFGWKFNKWGSQDYWLVDTGDASKPGINGGLLPRRGDAPGEMAPVHGYVCTADVDNLDAHLAKLGPSGGTLALPKMAIPTVGWLAYGKDTEGNIFGMMQADPNAK